MAYKMGSDRFKIKGKLVSTDQTVKPVRVDKRHVLKDEAEQLWVKIFGKYWKYPEEVEY